MNRLDIRLLGPFEVTLDGKPVEGFESAKVRALLAVLAVEADRPQRRDQLAGLLWPDWPQKSAMSNLRYALSDLRKNIGDREAEPPFLTITRQTIQLDLESDCWVDVKTLTQDDRPPTDDRTAVIRRLRSAVENFRGDFMEGFSLPDSPAFEDWMRAKGEYYLREVLGALDDLVERLIEAEECDDALKYARRAIEIEPWHEPAHRQVIRLLAMQGRRAEAVAQYERLREALGDALEIEPSTETQALLDRVRAGELEARLDTGPQSEPESSAQPGRRDNLPAQLTSFVGREREIEAVRKLLDANRLVTLTGHGGTGKTRLALQAAESVLENYPDGVWLVELASLSDPDLVPQTVASALGLQGTANRSHIEMVEAYLRDSHLLLVLDNCEHLAEACAWLAERLLPACPDLTILASSREILGVMGEAPFLVPPLSLPTAVYRLDDDGLPPLEEMAQFDSIHLFVERARIVSPDFELNEKNLRFVLEVVRRLNGIPLAIELAAARLRVLSVEGIAQRLDDAFRLLTGGRRGALPRHQTLRASIDWSYDLLDVPEQALLRRLSVFAGHWTLEAAEYVCADEGASGTILYPEDVLDLLTGLVEKSLIHTTRESGSGNRFQMLEIVRQYAHEKLVEAREAWIVRDRYLAYFLELAEKSAPKLQSRKQVIFLNKLERELDNLRLALAWALEGNQSLAMLRLVHALHSFWLISRHIAEGARWTREALIVSGDESEFKRSPWRAWTLVSLGRLSLEVMENIEAARLMLVEAETIFRGNEDRPGIAQALYARALLDFKLRNYTESQRLHKECIEIARAVGDQWLVAQCLYELGDSAWYQGDDQKAWDLYEESIALFREIGDRWILADPLNELANLYFLRGDAAKARWLLEEVLAQYRKPDERRTLFKPLIGFDRLAANLGDFELARSLALENLSIVQNSKNKWDLAWVLLFAGMVNYLVNDLEMSRFQLEESLQVGKGLDIEEQRSWVHEILGQVYIRQGEIDQGIAMLEACLAFSREHSHAESTANKLLALGDALRFKGNYEQAAACYRECLAVYIEIGFLAKIPPELEGFAKIAFLQDRGERAARLFGAAQAGRERFETPVPPVEQAEYDASLASLRESLGEARFEQLLSEGWAMSIEEAVAYALEAV